MINQKISDIQSGKLVEFNIQDAYELINKTQGLGDVFDKFLDGASDTVKNVEFQPVQIKDTREYLVHHFKMEKVKRRKANIPVQINHAMDMAEIYLQKYNINIKGTNGQIFIWRTPSKKDFDLAKSIILEVLENFIKVRDGAASNNGEGMVQVRGIQKFFDIKTGNNALNSAAWIGIDFRK